MVVQTDFDMIMTDGDYGSAVRRIEGFRHLLYHLQQGFLHEWGVPEPDITQALLILAQRYQAWEHEVQDYERSMDLPATSFDWDRLTDSTCAKQRFEQAGDL